jgi:hypothetical protein
VLHKTYEIKSGPPAPSIEEYAKNCQTEWHSLLDHAPEEKDIQSFLERNPAFLPGAWTPNVKSGHYPLHCAAISQPILPGLKTRIPDFMWISTHSSMWYPTLIEIEKPSKRIFTSAGIPSAQFSQARNQLAQWRTWFSSPENVHMFMSSYGIPDWMHRGRQMQLHLVLIYGRRHEFKESPALSKQRAFLMNTGEELISYDRLSFDSDLRDAITIRAVGNGKFRALHVPPSFRHRPDLADRLLVIDEIEAALSATPLITDERREFLISRIPYWMNWEKKEKCIDEGNFGLINMGDSE